MKYRFRGVLSYLEEGSSSYSGASTVISVEKEFDKLQDAVKEVSNNGGFMYGVENDGKEFAFKVMRIEEA